MARLNYIPWALFSALRAFALSGRNWTIGLLVLVLSMVPVGLNFATARWAEVILDPQFGCYEASTISPTISKFFQLSRITARAVFNVRNAVTILSRTSLILADLIVIVVTWTATYRTTMIARQGAISQSSLSVLFLRDGLVYFIVLLIINVLHLAFSTSTILAAIGTISDISILFEPISAVLVSRFLLNLQQANRRLVNQYSTSTTTERGTTSSIRFDRAVGSLGNSIILSADDDDFADALHQPDSPGPAKEVGELLEMSSEG
ncbi:hypothetical protein C8T65DRAFT_741821 [Cerioporus squamosus]|nr:hypothetical protein C8T65DRAFT_741821 [Cerioporus squamosus]